MGVPTETRTVKRVLALAGGVGGAKLALGLYCLLQPHELTIVVNTGDDEIFHGLQVCPDLDTVMYTLSGIVNPETGWGVNGETFHALSAMEKYGMPTWFRLGDLDLATHIRRTELLHSGWSLSQVSRELCTKLNVNPIVIPMYGIKAIISTSPSYINEKDIRLHKFHGSNSIIKKKQELEVFHFSNYS